MRLAEGKLISEINPDKIEIQSNFPNLFGSTSWGTVTCRFELLNEMPPLNLISNVNLVPFKEDRWLVLRLQTGEWEVPGGTLEPGESYSDAISRELMEEAGARLKTFEPLGAWHCFSTASKPYRSHLPHPEFYRLVGYGAIEIISNPENPEGGEQVASVEFVPIEEAIQRFRDINRFELAELYQLAARMREARNEKQRKIGI
ncbi:NUDIX hydrolase [Candidatus Poribacteria bacterium]|nr:MAG: NUDIX hydrolase [Candidatus Poribacteria bacterium]